MAKITWKGWRKEPEEDWQQAYDDPILILPTFFVGIFVGIEYHLLVFISFSSIQYSLALKKLPLPSNG